LIKYVYCVRKPDSLSPEQFRHYWLNEHAALFRNNAEAMRIRRYAQSHTIDHPINRQLQKSRGTLQAFDGVGEIWWDSVEELIAAASSREGSAAMDRLREDDVHFIDPSRSSVFITEVHTIVER
jgi:uncharacterized protein (TIGR02118 family)